MSWTWKFMVKVKRLSSRSTLENAQNGQKIHQKASGYINMQILPLALTQLLKVLPKKGEHSL